jgi:predicted MFS family arabinose efflux permease
MTTRPGRPSRRARVLGAVIDPYRGLPSALNRLLVAQAIIAVGHGAIYPFISLYITERMGVDVVVAGAINSLFFVCAAAGGLVAGTVADRWGRRPVLVISVLADGLTLLALGWAPTLGIVVATLVVSGFVGNAAFPVTQAVIADTAPDDRRSVIYGINYQILGVGWFLGPVLAAPIIAVSGLGAVFPVAAAAIILASALFSRLPETLEHPAAGAQAAGPVGSPARSGAAASSAPATESGADLSPGGLTAGSPGEAAELRAMAEIRSPVPGPSVRPWYRDPRLLAYVGLHLFTIGAYIQLFTIFPVDARDRLGMSTEAWAGILALNGFLILTGQGIMSRTVRRYLKPRVVASGVLLWAAGFATLGLVTGTPGIVVAMIVLTLGEMMVFPIQPAVVADLAPSTARARYQGALTMGGSIGNAIAPLVAGAAVAALGGGWWLILGGLMAGLAMLYLLFGRLAYRSTPPTSGGVGLGS